MPPATAPSGPLAPPERAEASGSYHLDLILRIFLVRVVGGKILAKICILEFFSMWEEENSIFASVIIMAEIYELCLCFYEVRVVYPNRLDYSVNHFLVLDEVFA